MRKKSSDRSKSKKRIDIVIEDKYRRNKEFLIYLRIGDRNERRD